MFNKLGLRVSSFVPAAGLLAFSSFTQLNAQNELSIERRIGKTIFCHVNTHDAKLEGATLLIKEVSPAGIVFYNWANPQLSTRQETTKLIADIRKIGNESLLLGIDQEGGRVDRLKYLACPSQRYRATSYDELALFDNYSWVAKELKKIGFNVVFGPVADVNTDPDNPVIGNRSFSPNPATVKKCAQIAIERFNQNGIISCPKHFPGHGNTKTDSHRELAVVELSKEELIKDHISVFKALAKHSPMIMTGHIMTALDPDFCATLSAKTLQYLRSFYDGVIVADSLTMRGVLKNTGPIDTESAITTEQIANAAICAINAGCDLIILGGKELNESSSSQELSVEDIIDIRNKLVNAVKSGKLSLERLKEANQRVEKLKKGQDGIQKRMGSKTSTA